MSWRMWNGLTSWQDAQVGNKLGSHGGNQQNDDHVVRCPLKRCGVTECECECVWCLVVELHSCECVCLVFSCGVTLV